MWESRGVSLPQSALYFFTASSMPDRCATKTWPFALLSLLLVQDVQKSRQIDMQAKAFALENPDKLLVIAIDGSDQSSYATPYFSQATKDSCKGWKKRHPVKPYRQKCRYPRCSDMRPISAP